jgi:hypothetical protein
MYEAQPTPGVTWMAPAAQFWAHAPHSMHPSRSTISAFFSFILNTAWGQTLSHTPQPTQASVSSFSVVTPSRYLKFSTFGSFCEFVYIANYYLCQLFLDSVWCLVFGV